MSKATYMTQKDALELVIDSAESKITRDIIVNTEIGSYKPGDKIDMGEDLTNVIEKLVTVYQTPELTVTLNPSTTLYEKGVDSLSSLKITAQVTKKSNPIKSIKWYMGSSELGEYTVDDKPSLPGGGTFDYNYSGTISNDVTIKVVVTDSENKTVTKEIPIKFVGMSYYGILSDSVTTVSESDITSLNKILKDTKEYTYSGITTDYGKICYAIPSMLGEITNFQDKVNNFSYNEDFEKQTLTINGIPYNCYVQTEAAGMTDIKMSFS